MTETRFSDLNLLPEIQQALEAAGYQNPTSIQAQAIPHLLNQQDLLGCAQTGTGKTAAFALPLLHHLGSNNRRSQPGTPRVLVLCPTRELAAQIGDSFETYGRFLRLRHTVIFGGVNQGKQVRALQRGVHILIATPGRLLDLMNQGHVRLNQLEVFVLDEADRMLDMGFLPDLKRIIAHLPEQRQSLFFSATLPQRVAELASSLLNNPVKVEITPQSTTVDRIEQQVLFVPQREKKDQVLEILRSSTWKKALIFTRTKRGADKLSKQLWEAGIRSEAIHGNKSQAARTKILERYRSGRVQVLVATDLAARGIDVEGITHVINYDLPHEPESYVHRIGRTGRAGASGSAFTLCDMMERGQLRAIEKLIRMSIPVHADFPDQNVGTSSSGRPRNHRPPRRGRPSSNRRPQSRSPRPKAAARVR